VMSPSSLQQQGQTIRVSELWTPPGDAPEEFLAAVLHRRK